MQPAIRDTCTMQMDREQTNDERINQADHPASRIRRTLDDALDWLDRHWDDPELRSGFWNSGW